MLSELNRRNKNKPDKDENSNKPEVPDNPGTEDSSDKQTNKAQQGTHIYTYDELNQLVYRKDSQNQTYTYSYDLRGNCIAETGKKESRDYVIDYTSIERDDLMVYAEGSVCWKRGAGAVHKSHKLRLREASVCA